MRCAPTMRPCTDAQCLCSFWRLDLLAGGSVTFDSGYGAYLSMLMMDHHNKYDHSFSPPCSSSLLI